MRYLRLVQFVETEKIVASRGWERRYWTEVIKVGIRVFLILRGKLRYHYIPENG